MRNILDFSKQFSQPACQITLDRNYRSTQPILDASNAVIAAALERHAKTLWTDKVSSALPQLVLIPDESEQGLYSERIDHSFRWSMSWFIFSEVMFFAAFFGALFYARKFRRP